MARALASNMEANFLKVVSSAIVDKYIGESARIIREMFGTNTPPYPQLSILTLHVFLFYMNTTLACTNTGLLSSVM